MNGGPSVFDNAPITRTFVIASVLFTILFEIEGRTDKLELSYPNIFKILQLWKIIVLGFSLSSTAERMFGVHLLYCFRLLERQIGSNKYSAALTSVTSHGPWGGSGGDIWKYQTSHGITKIIMQVGGNIKSIYFRDSADRTSGVLGGMGQDLADRGEQKTVDIKWPEEYIKSIHGTYGFYKRLQVITSLSFTTNLRTYGPFGSSIGTCFASPDLDSNHAIVGFYGKFGYYLDSIGTLAAPICVKPPVSIAAVGGGGGNPWSYVTNKGIRKIILNFGKNVKSLTFQDSTGATSVKFGGRNHNDIGKQYTVCIDTPDEFMTSIKVTYGNFAHMTTITSISFVTNKRTYGPYGMRYLLDKEYCLSSPNTKIVGFHGKAGHYIDSIGIFVSPV